MNLYEIEVIHEGVKGHKQERGIIRAPSGGQVRLKLTYEFLAELLFLSWISTDSFVINFTFLPFQISIVYGKGKATPEGLEGAKGLIALFHGPCILHLTSSSE